MDEQKTTDWQQIRSSLRAFDPAVTLWQLQELLSQELHYEELQEDELWLLAKKIDTAIAAAAGSWYGVEGLVVGNECFPSYCGSSRWCWCHSFVSSIKAPSQQQRLEQAAREVLGQVELLHQFLVNLCALFDQLPLSASLEIQEAQIKTACERIINFVIAETRCNDAWYNYANKAVGWFLEDKGIPVPESLYLIIDCSFNSWIAPSERVKHSVTEVIAFEVLKQEFERQYPSKYS